MSATYTKLRDGSWGVRVTGGTVSPGQTVTVTKKSGETKSEVIGKVLWTGDDGTVVATIGSGMGCGSPSVRKCRECGVNETSLRRPYEKMLRNGYCSPCWKERDY